MSGSMKKVFFITLCSLFSLGADYQPKDFTYLLGKVEGLDDALLKMHFTLYNGYVKNTNILLRAIDDVDESSIVFGALKRRFGWEFDGMVLHEAYFENLGGKEPLAQNDPLYQLIVSEFGSFEAWKKNFTATGLIRGIGWVILYKDPKDGHLHNVWINEHDLGHLAGGTPLLVMDVWEHAYITEFGLNRAGYIKVFFDNINWSVVANRLQ